MKLLVIGKQGQLARSLAELDIGDALHVTALGRPDIDLTAPETIISAMKMVAPDIVVNAAAYTAVDQAQTEPNKAALINAEGAGQIADACQNNGVPLIHISTDYVFDGKKTSPYSEQDAVDPLGVYGSSKLAGERMVATRCQHHIILRTAWVFSPFGRNFVKTMLRLATERTDIQVVDDQIGSPTYAPHLADAIYTIAQKIVRNPGQEDWGLYHCAGSGDATWCDIAKTVFEVSSRLNSVTANVQAISSAKYSTPVQRPANSRLNCEKLARIFSVQMPDWAIGVTSCVTRLAAKMTT